MEYAGKLKEANDLKEYASDYAHRKNISCRSE